MVQTNSTIFDKSIFNLPKSRNDEDILDFLSGIFSNYLKELSKFNKEIRKELKIKIPFIENQITLIKKSLELYLNGYPAAAYNQLSEALRALMAEDYLPVQKTDFSNVNSSLYRARISTLKTLKREELFHIPFEIREKVATQRYSIPGLPCLYLADSTFVCWEEMGRPNIDSFHVSRVDLSKSGLKFLYFDTSSSEIRKKCFPSKNKEGKLLNLLIPYLCYWPMLTACSLTVRKPDEVFKPEYVIPQLLLQWIVSEQKIDGVVYKSNRIKISNHNLGTFKNIVIPVRKISAKGFCPELKHKIKITNPISYQILEIAGSKSSEKTIETADLRRAMFIELIEGEKAVYSGTIFGQLENKLNSLIASHL